MTRHYDHFEFPQSQYYQHYSKIEQLKPRVSGLQILIARSNLVCQSPAVMKALGLLGYVFLFPGMVELVLHVETSRFLVVVDLICPVALRLEVVGLDLLEGQLLVDWWRESPFFVSLVFVTKLLLVGQSVIRGRMHQ